MAKVKSKASTLPERRKAAMYAQMDIWHNRAAGFLVFLILCIQPLYLNSNRYYRLTWHKYVFFVVYMVIVLLTAAIIWAKRILNEPRLGIRERPRLVEWAILAFAFVTLASALLSPYKKMIDLQGLPTSVWIGMNERYDGLLTQLFYVSIFLITARWYKPAEKQFVLFGISAIIIALIGILQFYGMDFLKLWPTNDIRYAEYNSYNMFFRSTLGNVNIVSTYVCAAILLCGFLYIKMTSKWKYVWLVGSALNFWLMELADADSGRVGVIIAMVLMIPFIIENARVLGKSLWLVSSWIAVYTLQKYLYEVNILGSRTLVSLRLYMIILAASIILAILLTSIKTKEPQPDDPVRWKAGVILIVICITAGIGGVEILGRRGENESQAGIIYELREVMHGNIQDEFGTNRVYIWRNALRAFPLNPIIGTGPDTFMYAFPIEAHNAYGEPYDKAHNEYLQILICQGILGLASYLVFLGATAVIAIPKAFKNPLLMPVFASFVGYIAQAFFNISLPITSQLLWVFAGLLVNKNVWALENSEKKYAID